MNDRQPAFLEGYTTPAGLLRWLFSPEANQTFKAKSFAKARNQKEGPRAERKDGVLQVRKVRKIWIHGSASSNTQAIFKDAA